MPSNKETLEAKSGRLHGESTDEAVKVNRALLKEDPAHVAATNRLGIAHIARGEREKAIEVLEAGVAANPDNRIAQHRLEGLHKPPPPAKKPAKRAVKAKA